MFDRRIAYERLLTKVQARDRELLQAAIRQAATPYEPVANEGAASFFKSVRNLIAEHYPDLIMKRDPNADGVRPADSRTIYFDTPKTLRIHEGVPRPKMSLQCWDNSAPSASVKIMLTGFARLTDRLPVPTDLADIGGYLRPAGRALGIVVDTPRLDTQREVAEQLDDVAEALEAALRLQRWWDNNAVTLRRWVLL